MKSVIYRSAIFLVALAALWVAPNQSLAQNQNELVSLNVKEMAVQEVLKIAAEKGGFNLAMGPGVRGSITLFVEGLPVKKLLELAVDMVGAAYAIEDDVVWVMTEDDFEERYGRPYRDILRQRTLKISHTPVQDVAAVLSPLRSKQGQIVQDVRSNSLLISETPYYMEKMREVVGAIDNPLETRAFEVENVPASAMVEGLKEYLPPPARADADAADARVLVTASPAVLTMAERVVELLDRTERPETVTFALDYADPDSTMTFLKELLTPEISRIAVDRRSRQLIVTDFPSRLAPVRERLESLDLPTRQVLIEAKIVQVTFNEGIRAGINWSAIEDNFNVSAPFGAASDGVSVQFTDTVDDTRFDVLVDALETFGTSDLLSSPRVLVSDGQEASILVGSQIPYRSTNTRNVDGVVETFDEVTVVDVGVQLNVAVSIHLDGMVEMNINPEVSSVSEFREGVPVVETSATSSRILVPNGETVVLSGLKRSEVRKTRAGVPVLSRIPLLGWFFSRTDNSTVETELAIFLTPTITHGIVADE